MVWRRIGSLIVAVVVLLASMAVSASASKLWMQDDFHVVFGEVGNPFAAGTTIDADGRVVLWEENQLLGWFTLTGRAGYAAMDMGDQWAIVFDQDTNFTIYNEDKSQILWTGSYPDLCIYGNKDGSAYSVSYIGFDRPDYEIEPSTFQAVGITKPERTGGVWTDSILTTMFGFYNTNFVGVQPNQTDMWGNMQGSIEVVPEPGTLAALGTGLVGLIGFASRKRIK